MNILVHSVMSICNLCTIYTDLEATRDLRYCFVELKQGINRSSRYGQIKRCLLNIRAFNYI